MECAQEPLKYHHYHARFQILCSWWFFHLIVLIGFSKLIRDSVIMQFIIPLFPLFGVLNLFVLHYLALDFYLDLVKERFLGRKLTAKEVYSTISALTTDESDKYRLPIYMPRALRGVPDDVLGMSSGRINIFSS
jgi:hypothetical protein